MFSLRASRQVLTTCKLVETPLLRCFLHTSKPSSTFAKDLFLGRFNKKKVFPFPEPLNEEQLATLNMLVEPVEKYFEDKMDSAQIDKDAKIPEDVLQGLRELGLFGLQIPEEYGGLGLLNTNYARVAEAFSTDASIAVTLMAHQLIGLSFQIPGTVSYFEGEKQDKITAFIVERKFGGVTSGKPEDKLGIRGSNTCEIHFDNTPILVENVLDKVGGGFKVAMNILNSGRFGVGAGAGGRLRKLIANASEHAITRKQFNRHLSEFGQIQEKFASMTLKQYTIESMSYLTTGMLDSGEEDASVEAAMCKGTNEILRMYIALAGMQHAGKQLQEMLIYLKNPFANLEFMMDFATKRFLYFLGLKGNLQGISSLAHPQLADSVKKLEENIADFGRITENLLTKYGKNIIEEQMPLRRVADACINLFAMTAISRATRSINQVLSSAAHEVLLANTICKDKYNTNNALFKEIKSGSKKNGDEDLKKITTDIFNNGGCVAPHTLHV